MERTNIYLDDDTRAAAQHIRELYALPSDSAAVRYAIRELAMRSGWKPGGEPPKPTRQRRQARKAQDAG